MIKSGKAERKIRLEAQSHIQHLFSETSWILRNKTLGEGERAGCSEKRRTQRGEVWDRMLESSLLFFPLPPSTTMACACIPWNAMREHTNAGGWSFEEKMKGRGRKRGVMLALWRDEVWKENRKGEKKKTSQFTWYTYEGIDPLL